MSVNVEVLKRKVTKALDKLPQTAYIFRTLHNSLGEPAGEQAVTAVKGQYYRGAYYRGKNAFVSINADKSGRTANKSAEKFMTVIDDLSALIQPGDIAVIEGVRYEITDLGDNFGVYYDLSLRRLP